MSNNETYEVLIDVQQKKCHTCVHYKACPILTKGASTCQYKPNSEAKSIYKKAKPFFGYK